MVELGTAVAGGGGVSFSVVFYDGERDINIGNVIISSSTDFKNFQSILSKKIGISSHQFTVYLADGWNSHEPSTMSRRRIPITGRVNFGAIAGETDCFFLVVLRRSRRERRRKGRDIDIDIDDDYYFKTKTKTHQPKKKNPPENVMLLRRTEPLARFGSSIMDRTDRFDYEEKIRKLRLEKENYLINMGFREFSVAGDYRRNFTVNGEPVICRDCLNAKDAGVEVGFHCCANDVITAGFRSRVGPVSRPVKGSE